MEDWRDGCSGVSGIRVMVVLALVVRFDAAAGVCGSTLAGRCFRRFDRRRAKPVLSIMSVDIHLIVYQIRGSLTPA